MKEQWNIDIAHNDTMYEGNRDAYMEVGESALRCVKTVMAATGKTGFQNILDFASGFGRVLRVFRAAFPRAQLTACDVSKEGVEFCAKAFGATPVVSSENPAELHFNTKFDLVWCGSLVTHFDAPQFSTFVKLLRSLISPGGVLVFTTHGPLVARRLLTHAAQYGLDEDQVNALLSGYNSSGFGYTDYKWDVRQVGVTKYGFSVSKPSWVFRQIESLPDTRLVGYTEHAWDNHQDVVACMNP
jgi:SAM-dependent methyltransferase